MKGVAWWTKGWIVVSSLMLLVLVPHMASSLGMVCQTFDKDVSLREYENLLFHTMDEIAIIRIRSEPCNMSDTYFVNVSQELGNNTDLKDADGWQWYGISYIVDGNLLQVTLVGNTTYNIDRTSERLLTCNLTNGIEFRFDEFTTIGAYCFDKPRSFPGIDSIVPDYDKSLMDLRSNFDGSYGQQHVIFIPVGAILFLISVCCRCWYRRKSALRPVRTITVVRSVSTTDVSDAQNDLDLPPAYADIQNEMAPPPSYSEIEKLPMPPPAASPTVEAPPPEQSPGEDTDDCNTDLVSHDPSGPDSVKECRPEESNDSSTLPKMLSSRARSLAQFSFKPLQEEV